MMSSTLLRWLAGRLVEAAGQVVANWMLDTCNTEPPVLRPGRYIHTRGPHRFAIGIRIGG